MRYNGIIVFLGALTLAFSAGAQSLRDSLSADGPFILHRDGGARKMPVSARFQRKPISGQSAISHFVASLM